MVYIKCELLLEIIILYESYSHTFIKYKLLLNIILTHCGLLGILSLQSVFQSFTINYIVSTQHSTPYSGTFAIFTVCQT